MKLWENSVVVKIAVKRGIQNTNNKIMAEELKVRVPFFDSRIRKIIPAIFLHHESQVMIFFF